MANNQHDKELLDAFHRIADPRLVRVALRLVRDLAPPKPRLFIVPSSDQQHSANSKETASAPPVGYW